MSPTPALRVGALAVVASISALLGPATPASATSLTKPVTAVISVSTSGKTGNSGSAESDVSNGGRFVAFSSTASDLVPGDTNHERDIFVRDTLAATTIRVNVSSAGAQANQVSDGPSISSNGRFVAFRSQASNLVAGDTNQTGDIFVRDLRLNTTVRASLKDGGTAQVFTGASAFPTITADGTQVVFSSLATDLVVGDTNGKSDAFVRNLSTNETELVSVADNEAPLLSGARNPSISGNGRYVTFTSGTNQVAGDVDNHDDVFWRDRVAGKTERASLSGSAGTPNDASDLGLVSDDGRYVVFQSLASNLTMYTDAPAAPDVFVRDRTNLNTDLVSKSSANQPATLGGTAPSMSADGTKIAFSSYAANLTSDTNGVSDVFVRDLSTFTTARRSITTVGGQLNKSSLNAAMSPDGLATAFTTDSALLYDQDANNTYDIFVRSTFQIGPFADSTGLIQHSAQDFNGVQPSIGTVVANNNKVLYGVASPASTIDEFAHGTFDDQRGPVMRLYWAFFERMPDLGGLNYWTGKYAKGMSLKTIANGFATSSEFKTKYGVASNSAFVTLVYQNVLDRNPDPAGLAHWVNKMTMGTSRGEMMTNFSESSEGKRKMRGEIDTVLVYLGMLHRLPTNLEFGINVNILEGSGGQPTEVIILNMLTSSSYAATIN